MENATQTKMTKESLAATLHGRQYREEMSADEERQAKEAGLLVIFGASDDLTEFRGAICDEAGAWDGAEHEIDRYGTIIERRRDHNDLVDAGWTPPKPVLHVLAEWCPDGFDGSWRISANAPYAPFDIMADGERYCQGIVVDWAAVIAEHTAP